MSQSVKTTLSQTYVPIDACDAAKGFAFIDQNINLIDINGSGIMALPQRSDRITHHSAVNYNPKAERIRSKNTTSTIGASNVAVDDNRHRSCVWKRL